MESSEKSNGNQYSGQDNGKNNAADLFIAGIGASAGGIQALKEFFEHVSAKSGIAYVVILHLSPDHDSKLAEVLQLVTTIPVRQVMEKTPVQADHIYVVPPNQHLIMEDGFINVSPNLTLEDRRAPVDIFFRTLAASHGTKAACVVLSGTGANGSMGLKRIKECGGAAFVQNPREAEFNEMPRNSIATALVDEVLPVASIPSKIVAYKEKLGKLEIPVDAGERLETQQSALREIFTHLRVRTGHDFSNYKRPTLLRRIERRINIRMLHDLPAYALYMREHPDETTALLKDILISVTNFFRDHKAFEVLEKDILPRILKSKSSEDQVRIWVAGCATGEEAYSIAMLLAEQTLGILDAPKIQIFATDIDEAAIAIAREGLYTINDAADVSAERLRRFFNKESEAYRVRREVREMILFAHHNFIKDPPFSHLDLLTCRNVLIYLNHIAQERVVETFHFALKPGAFLFLGSSESVDGASDLYAHFNKEQHIFQSRQVGARSYPVPESVPTFHIPAPRASGTYQDQENRSMERITYGDLHQRLLEQYAPPSLVVNEEYDIVYISERAGRFLQIAGGEPSQNLLKLIRPELRLELRSALYQAVQRKSAVEVKALKVTLEDNRTETIHLHVKPVLRDEDIARGFILVVFETSTDQPEKEIQISADEPVARHLEDELIRIKNQLRNSIEQHEFQAEELKASNEELQAMNEELRSAAEELETSKEELQSINEELSTVNQELKVKIEETTLSGNNLQNLINSADIGTIFLDRSFRVMFFTPAARTIFNLIQTDFGRPLSDITSRLEYHALIEDVEMVLESLHSIEREVHTTDGKTFMMRVLPYRTAEDRINGVVITFFDISTRKAAEQNLRQSEARLAEELNVLNRLHDLSLQLVTAPDVYGASLETLKIICKLVNASLGTIQLFQKEVGGLQYITEFGEDAEALSAIPFIKEKILFEKGENFKAGQRLIVADYAAGQQSSSYNAIANHTGFRAWYSIPLHTGDGRLFGVITLFFRQRHQPGERELHAVDLYAGQASRFIERKQGEENLRASEERFRTLNDAVPQLIWTNDSTGTANYFNQRWFEYSGLTQTESLGRGWEAIIHPDDAPEAIERWRMNVQEGKVFDAEFRLKRFDNVYRWHIARNVPMLTREGSISGWFGSATDIQDLKMAVRSLHESSERLRVTLDSSTDFAIITLDTKGIINGWNKGAHNLLGYEEPEAIGKSATIFFTEEDVKKQIPEKEMTIAEAKGRAIDERWHKPKDGPDIFLSGVLSPMYNGNELIGYVKVARDITAQKKYEEALKALEERYRIALASAGMGTWDWNIQDGSITWNDQHFVLLGLEPENKLVNVDFFMQFVHPDDQNDIKQSLHKAVRETAVYHAEYRVILPPKNEIRWMSGYGRAMGDGHQDAKRMVGVIYDITERKRLEKEKEEFVNIASHEIKTPLTSIKAYAELLQSMFEDNSNEQYAQFMQKMNLQIDRLNELIGDLLDTTKVSEGQLPLRLQTFNLNELVTECAGDLEHISASHKIVVNPGKIAAVTADRERIGQVLVNIINNAIKYSPAGGNITVTTSGDDATVKVDVHDKGIGIPMEMQAKVFDRFFRVSNASANTAPGMGLGLYISAGIVNRHGGTISVNSEPGQGTLFSFTLPYKAKNKAN